MELMQATQAAQAGGAALLGTALTLGLRHGIDWDHVAAIADITGASAGPPGGRAALPGRWWSGQARRALALGSSYAAGHAAVVVALGLAALYFQAILPAWLDPLMQRVVGLTLLLLGAWLVYALVRSWRGGAELQLRSRWMLLFGGVGCGWRALQARLHGHGHDGSHHVHRLDQYDHRTAFGVGLIHGIGAETGSQVLLLAALGGAASQGLGTAMLGAFVVGLVLSNAALALVGATGFVTAGRARSAYTFIGLLTASFSLLVGSAFVLGTAPWLPALPG